MPPETQHNVIATAYQIPTPRENAPFAGFRPPTSNTTYAPNQFFDVVLPNASRGCIRVVGYLIRKTLGWCDSEGNPQHEQIEVSYSELERRAGVGHAIIRSALDEAVAGHFIECLQPGRARSIGDAGQPALYALKWDSRPHYARTMSDFRGFFEGEGHRTDIPNEFFDFLIPRETVAVIGVVGSIIRYSIGFQAKHGRRRQQATLSYGQILEISGLSSRRTLAAAIKEALAKNYIVRLDPGRFSALIEERRSATYAVRWSDGYSQPSAQLTPKRIPEELGITHSEMDTSGSADQAGKDTSNAPERIPAEHSEKETIEITPLNEKPKQAEVAALLRKQGFDEKTAEELAARYDREVILRQIAWLPARNATRSAAGLLRRAIEGDWPAPVRLGDRSPRSAEPELRQTTGNSERYENLAPQYFSWLAEQEEELRRTAPAEYARFVAKRERRLEDIRSGRNPIFREKLLDLHHSDRGRLTELQKFMALPDFQQWDAEFNNQSQYQS